MIASQLNHQIILLLKRPLTQTVDFSIWLTGGISAFYLHFLFWFITAIFKLNFLKPTSLSFGYDDYYASARMVASHLSPNYFIAKAPSNPLLILPFKLKLKFMEHHMF